MVWGVAWEPATTSRGVGWDMSIPQKLFIDWLLNGSLFPETSASIPFPLFFEVVFIDKT